jgi:transcription initiation factor TFIIIB Brf1 subunit/transcription initiation factor TFIIB
MLTQKKCPHCGAIDSLDVDYLRGEVACNECAIVCEAGLLEDPRTAFDDEGTVQQHGLRSVAATTSGTKAEKTTLDKTSARAFDILNALKARTGAPEAVVEVAQGFFENFSVQAKAKNTGGVDAPLLATGCFQLAAELRHCPIQSGEFATMTFLRGVNASKLAALRKRLVSDLGLAEQVKALAGTFHRDLVALYARRLKPRALTPKQCDVATAVAQEFTHLVSGKNPPVVVQYAVYVTVYDAGEMERMRASAGLVLDAAFTTEKARAEGLVGVAQAAREKPDALQRLLQEHPVSSALVTGALARLAEAKKMAAAPSASSDEPVAGDRKRERD